MITALVLALLMAMGVKQTAYILINGTIFKGVRDFIKEMADDAWKPCEQLFWGKLHELFGCHICMAGQLSIWLVAVPTVVGAYSAYTDPLALLFGAPLNGPVTVILTIIGTLVFAMTIAGLATALWHLTEYLPQAREDQASFRNTLLDKLGDVVSVGHDLADAAEDAARAAEIIATKSGNSSDWDDDDDGLGEEESLFTLNDAYDLVRALRSCSDWSCGVQRRQCRIERLRTFLTEWARQKGGKAHREIERLRPQLVAMMKEYYATERAGNEASVRSLLMRHVTPT